MWFRYQCFFNFDRLTILDSVAHPTIKQNENLKKSCVICCHEHLKAENVKSNTRSDLHYFSLAKPSDSCHTF